jgi:hypothetical protein
VWRLDVRFGAGLFRVRSAHFCVWNVVASCRVFFGGEVKKQQLATKFRRCWIAFGAIWKIDFLFFFRAERSERLNRHDL